MILKRQDITEGKGQDVEKGIGKFVFFYHMLILITQKSIRSKNWFLMIFAWKDSQAVDGVQVAVDGAVL
jgi:hypothetical protein